MARTGRAAKVDFVTEVVAVEVHPSTLFNKGHEVYDWCHDINRQMEVATKALAPVGRSREYRGPKAPAHAGGELRRKICASMRRLGPEQIEMTITSGAPYTKFVHGGTAFQGTRYIYSTAGWRNKRAVDALASRDYFLAARYRTSATVRRGWYMVLPQGGGPKFRLRV